MVKQEYFIPLEGLDEKLLGWVVGDDNTVQSPLLRLLQFIPLSVYKAISTPSVSPHFEPAKFVFKEEDNSVVHLLVEAAAPAKVRLQDLLDKSLRAKVAKLNKKIKVGRKICSVITRPEGEQELLVRFYVH